MKKTILTALLAFGLGLGLTLIASTPSMAVHKGSTGLTCGGCHTMHSAQGGAGMDGVTTGNARLIRGAGPGAAQTTALCLSCHSQNGANAPTTFNTGGWATTPPKVHLTTAWSGGAPANFSGVGAGGDFASVGAYSSGGSWSNTATLGAALGKGHRLELTAPVPPGNSTSGSSVGVALTGIFSCVSCHDAHGTSATTTSINLYRNLKAGSAMNATAQNTWSDMAANLAGTYVGAVAGSATGGSATGSSSNIWPIINSGLTTQNVYYYRTGTVNLGGSPRTGDNGENVGISAFCAQCHGAWHEAVAAGNVNGANDWNRHPVNLRLDDGTTTSGSGTTIINTTNYGTAGVALPTANATTSTQYYMNTAATSKVFCLSCHFAHGGPYYDALRWDYTGTVSSGNQDGLAIASNVGCQQCHNR